MLAFWKQSHARCKSLLTAILERSKETERMVNKMSDSVDRNKAIVTAIEAADDWDGGHNVNVRRAQMIEAALKALPSAQTERKKGKWINDGGLYKCSCCNQLWTEWWVLSKPPERMRKECPYCPMCGSYNGE